MIFFYSNPLTKRTGLPRGNRGVETPGTSKHRTLSGCHHRSFPTRFYSHSRRESDKTSYKSPRCRQTGTGPCRFHRIRCIALTLLPVIRRRRRSQLSPFLRHNSWRPQRSMHLYQIPSNTTLTSVGSVICHRGCRWPRTDYRFWPFYAHSKTHFGRVLSHRAMDCAGGIERSGVVQQRGRCLFVFDGHN